MTYNIGGGRRDFGSALSDAVEVIEESSPDVLAVQEATDFQDADGVWHRGLDRIASATAAGEHVYFGPTLSMREHMHIRKTLFVHAIFNDWLDWRQGNAMLSGWPFVRLSDPSRQGAPRNVPLYRTPLYRGNRDTDPRYALLARIGSAPVFPFVVGVHLTTLVAEREQREDGQPESSVVQEARDLRSEQARRIVELLREHVLERGEVTFLLGDFNAMPGEACVSKVLEGEGGFLRLVPTEGPGATHSEAREPIDHILVYPGSRLVDYTCWIVDSPAAHEASDHLPVVADVWVA